MSESEHRKQRQSEVCDDHNDDDDEEDCREHNEEQEEDGETRCNGDAGESVADGKEVERNGVFGISRDFRSAIKRSFGRIRRRKEKEQVDGGGGVGCYVCFMQPRTEESPETPTSDPNSEGFNFEMLRALIESNDFYCKESNPHI